MSDLVVMTFAREDAAGSALERVKSLEEGGALRITDSAIIEKDADGRTRVVNQLDTATKGGAVAGGALGLLMSFFFTPVLGLAIGAAAGALIGKAMGVGVDAKFVEQVTAELTPGTSALFLIVSGNAGTIARAVQPFAGKVFQTSLDPDLEATLENALRANQ